VTASAVYSSIDSSGVPWNPILSRIVQNEAVCTILRIRRAADFGRRVHAAERTMAKQVKPGIVFVHEIWADRSSFSKVIPAMTTASFQRMQHRDGK
jgi:hypothetical protein